MRTNTKMHWPFVNAMNQRTAAWKLSASVRFSSRAEYFTGDSLIPHPREHIESKKLFFVFNVRVAEILAHFNTQ